MKRIPLVAAEIPIFAVLIASVLAVGMAGEPGIARAQTASFEITSTPPTELNASGGGPAQATLQQAAEFAWEEFFALKTSRRSPAAATSASTSATTTFRRSSSTPTNERTP